MKIPSLAPLHTWLRRFVSHHLPHGLLISLSMALTGCGQPVPDYTPFATGLEALGICLVCCAAVTALADLIKGHPPTQPPPAQNSTTPHNP